MGFAIGVEFENVMLAESALRIYCIAFVQNKSYPFSLVCLFCRKASGKRRTSMEKEMLALAKFKEGDVKFSKFMEWMQSDEGMA